MKVNYLLPNKYKMVGWCLFSIGAITGIITNILGPDNTFFDENIIKNFGFEFLDELIAIFIIVGGLLVGFTKEKIEDEFIYKLRNESLVWATIFNYIVLLVSTILFYEGVFLTIIIYNMFTPLLFFIIRFNFLKFKSRSDEE